MAEYGLIGRTLKHSFSKRCFEEQFSHLRGVVTYELFELTAIDSLPAFLKAHPFLRGFNVTIPYKESIIPYLDRLSPEAEAIGAVNCVKWEDGCLVGCNTDYLGVDSSFRSLLGGVLPERALVLGTGGASKAVCHALKVFGIPCDLVSRDPQKGDYTYETLSRKGLSNYRLIINATPVGTWPRVEEAPDIPYGDLTSDHFLLDLVYNPSLTAFQRNGALRGAHTMNGEVMLREQARASWRVWGLIE